MVLIVNAESFVEYSAFYFQPIKVPFQEILLVQVYNLKHIVLETYGSDYKSEPA